MGFHTVRPMFAVAFVVSAALPGAIASGPMPERSGIAAPQVAQAPRGAGPGAAQPAGGGQRGGGRGAIQVMTLTSTSWTSGGTIPVKHSQAGRDVSPPLAWSAAPEGTASFVLVVSDLDAVSGTTLAGALHWLVWNIPPTATGMPEGVPEGTMLADKSRQISVTGPNYRGPAAPATGPAHHYLFELYALDTMITVPNNVTSPAETRAAVMAAVPGHVRGKATLVGTFKRSEK